jgi:FMN phosphatase YigB (HAD superfamily)
MKLARNTSSIGELNHFNNQLQRVEIHDGTGSSSKSTSLNESIPNTSHVTSFITSKSIKLIVFDLHGTLTNRASIHPYHVEYRNKYVERKNKQNGPNKFDLTLENVFSAFSDSDLKEYYFYRDNDPLFLFDKIHSVTPGLSFRLQQIKNSFHTILHSDSYQKQIDKTLDSIGLQDDFDLVVGIEDGYTKKHSQLRLYNDLCAKFDIGIENVLIVGDRMDKDIDPLVNAGGNGIKVESSEYIMAALDIIDLLAI